MLRSTLLCLIQAMRIYSTRAPQGFKSHAHAHAQYCRTKRKRRRRRPTKSWARVHSWDMVCLTMTTITIFVDHQRRHADDHLHESMVVAIIIPISYGINKGRCRGRTPLSQYVPYKPRPTTRTAQYRPPISRVGSPSQSHEGGA